MARSEVVIVVPPFAGIDRPALGPHLLQACAKQVGVDVDIIYANLEFAALTGEQVYEAIAYASTSALAGERMFSRAAFGLPAWGRNADAAHQVLGEVSANAATEVTFLRSIEHQVPQWCQQIACRLVNAGYRIVGCSTTFEQTAASAALLRAVKQLDSGIITILGGANCDGPMGEALSSLNPAVDYIFRGESESTFVDFLLLLKTNNRPGERVLTGRPCKSLDDLPIPDFAQFFQQLERLGANRTGHWLSCETSRGCWWGEKQHCTFCGLNAEGMAMRHKSADRALAELLYFRQLYGPMAVCMTDNIMPHQYFESFLSRLSEQIPNSRLFYEVKANLQLAQVQSLVKSGVRVVQPGIESLRRDYCGGCGKA